jgi:hypothetical protein
VNLLCALGLHRPGGIPRWNDGFYFTTCSRCGSDLVRTAYQGWHVPSGYRVVWSPIPPEERSEVALVEQEVPPAEAAASPAPPEAQESELEAPAFTPPVEADVPPPAAEAPVDAEDIAPPSPDAPAGGGEAESEAAAPAPTARREGGLPIEELLAQLKEGEAVPPEPSDATPAAASAEPESAEQPPQPPARPEQTRGPGESRPYWDFMDEEPRPGSVPAPPAAAAAQSGEHPWEQIEETAGPSRAAAAAASMRGAFGRVAGPVRRGWQRPSGPHPLWPIGIALFISAVVGFSAASLIDRASPPAHRVVLDRVPGEPLVAGPVNAPGREEDRAFVAVSLLSCRSAPVRGAPRVRNLPRGAEVDVLAGEGEWLSIAHDGRQCWALAKYVSRQPPY